MFDQNDQTQQASAQVTDAATSAPLPASGPMAAPAPGMTPVADPTAPVPVSAPTPAPLATDSSTASPALDSQSFGSPAPSDGFGDLVQSAPAPITDTTSPAPTSSDTSSTPVSSDLLAIKKDALTDLTPLLSQLEQSPEEKFRTTMMLIQASDDQSLIQTAYAAAKEITDEKVRAQALLDIVNEINYFSQAKPTT